MAEERINQKGVMREIEEILAKSKKKDVQAEFEILVNFLKLRPISRGVEAFGLDYLIQKKKLMSANEFLVWKMFLEEEFRFSEEELENVMWGVILATVYERIKENKETKGGEG